MVDSKQPTSVFLDRGEVETHYSAGTDVLKFCSTNPGGDPNMILIDIGVEFTFKVVEAVSTQYRAVLQLTASVNLFSLMLWAVEATVRT